LALKTGCDRGDLRRRAMKPVRWVGGGSGTFMETVSVRGVNKGVMGQCPFRYGRGRQQVGGLEVSGRGSVLLANYGGGRMALGRG
jgi:hypothetical protein